MSRPGSTVQTPTATPEWQRQAYMREDKFKDWSLNFSAIPDSLKSGTNIVQQEGLIRESQQLCTSVVNIIHTDVLSVKRGTSTSKGNTLSTVGIMLTGCKIDNLLIGGPACNSAQLDKGDVILTIDGISVLDDNIHDLLVGEDLPGSTVRIGVQKVRTNQIHEVSMVRVASSEIADRRRLFELFTALKSSAQKEQTAGSTSRSFASSIGMRSPGRDAMESVPFMASLSHNRGPERDGSKPIGQLVDESIELWSKMVKEEEEAKVQMMQNVVTMQDEGYEALASLKEVLSQLFNVFLQDLQKFAGVKAAENLAPVVADLEAQLKALREKYNGAMQTNGDLEDENARLKAQFAEANREKERYKGRCIELEATALEKDKRIQKLQTERDQALGEAEGALDSCKSCANSSTHSTIAYPTCKRP